MYICIYREIFVMNIYIYIYIHTHTDIHALIYIYIYTDIGTETPWYALYLLCYTILSFYHYATCRYTICSADGTLETTRPETKPGRQSRDRCEI